jgi:hypothetical protein
MYVQRMLNYIEFEDNRRNEDLRVRADGSPSARRPAAVLPVAHWAVVTDGPDGEGYESTRDRLEGYRVWLQMLKDRGLYDGPTELTYTNPEPREGDE